MVYGFEREFLQFTSKLNIFQTLKAGDKISKDKKTNILYIDRSDTFQFIRRWWYGEGQASTFKYLDTLFTNYIKFLDKILFDLNNKGVLCKTRDLAIKISKFNNSFIEGLYSLKTTYPNNKKICAKVGSIILTLFDFTDTVCYFQIKKKLKRSNSF